MKTLIISYSRTGNNDKIADRIARELKCEQIKITESKPRTYFSIILDLVFNRVPKVKSSSFNTKKYNTLIFIAPVWFGQVASPLRVYFKQLKGSVGKYIFISVSGGANGPNPKLKEELKKRLGKAPQLLINTFIADILPQNIKPTAANIDNYRLKKENVEKICSNIFKDLS